MSRKAERHRSGRPVSVAKANQRQCVRGLADPSPASPELCREIRVPALPHFTALSTKQTKGQNKPRQSAAHGARCKSLGSEWCVPITFSEALKPQLWHPDPKAQFPYARVTPVVVGNRKFSFGARDGVAKFVSF